MPTTIRTSDVREVLALVPFQLGFHPTESAVLVSLRGARSQVGLVARVDLAHLADPDDEGHTARSVVGHLVADGARRAVAIVYTTADLQDGACWETDPAGVGREPDDDVADAGAGPVARAAVLALWRAALDGLGELETWVVGPHGYYALGCADPLCCPAGGRPLEDLQATRVSAQMVLEGLLVAPTRDDLVRLPMTTPAQRKAARRAAERWRARGATAAPGAAAHRWRREGLALWREAVGTVLGPDRGRPDDARPDGAGTALAVLRDAPVVFGERSTLPEATVTGRLLAALEDVLVRDAVLVSFVGDERVADRLVAGETGPAIGQALAAITDPVRGRRPDPGRAAAARAVLEHAVAHTTRGRHAPALTLLAVLAWWEGDGARAGLLVDRALAADPGHRLAVLVDQALRAGMPPGWARSDRAS